MPRSRKCVYLKDNGRPCARVADGNPPLCEEHSIEIAGEEKDIFQNALDQLLENDQVRGVLDKASGLVDRLGSFLSYVPQQANGAPRPRPTATPPRPQGMSPAQARMVLGFDGERLTKAMVKDRQRALAKVLHPDLKGGSTTAMQKLNEAANVLLKECRA